MKTKMRLIELLYNLFDDSQKLERIVEMLKTAQNFFLSNESNKKIGRLLSQAMLTHHIITLEEMELLISSASEIVITPCACQDYVLKHAHSGRKEFYFKWEDDKIVELEKRIRPAIHYRFKSGGLAELVKKYWKEYEEIRREDALELVKLYNKMGATFTSTKINPLQASVAGICTCFNKYNTCLNLRQLESGLGYFQK